LENVLDNIPPDKVFLKPISSAHNIIELTLHLNAWTEEALSRINGNASAEPIMGDWPLPVDKTEEYWNTVKQKLFTDTNKLIAAIKVFRENKLDEIVDKERNAPLGTGSSFEGLVTGLIQHNAYHSGQIALLKKSFL